MYEDLKALKVLLDEGIVTKEEYNRKKVEILGMEAAEDRTIPKKMEAESAKRAGRETGEKAKRAAEPKSEAKTVKLKKQIPLIVVATAVVLALSIAYGFGYLGGQPQADRLEREHIAQLAQETKANLSPLAEAIGSKVATGSSSGITSSSTNDDRSSIALMGFEGETKLTAKSGKCNGMTWTSKNEYGHDDTFKFIGLLDTYFEQESGCAFLYENESKGYLLQRFTWTDEDTNCEVSLEYKNYDSGRNDREKITVVWKSE